jgi:hypothetical protein
MVTVAPGKVNNSLSEFVQEAYELFENLYREAYGDQAADAVADAVLKASWEK